MRNARTCLTLTLIAKPLDDDKADRSGQGVISRSVFRGPTTYFAIPDPTLKTLRRAKQVYNNPTGYATRSLCSDIRRTATKMLEADHVHHKTDMADST